MLEKIEVPFYIMWYICYKERFLRKEWSGDSKIGDYTKSSVHLIN